MNEYKYAYQTVETQGRIHMNKQINCNQYTVRETVKDVGQPSLNTKEEKKKKNKTQVGLRWREHFHKNNTSSLKKYLCCAYNVPSKVYH